MSARAVVVLFLGLAALLAVLGFWTQSWWPFAGSVLAAAVAALAWTTPPTSP